MLKIEFETDNAAFEGDMCTEEVAAILRKIADRLESRGSADDCGTVTDSNGNTVGTWECSR